MIKGVDYVYIHVHVNYVHVNESTVHSNDINISYCEKTSKIGENPLGVGRLGVSSKICHFGSVLKTLNNLYQQNRHLELNTIVQMILS